MRIIAEVGVVLLWAYNLLEQVCLRGCCSVVAVLLQYCCSIVAPLLQYVECGYVYICKCGYLKVAMCVGIDIYSTTCWVFVLEKSPFLFVTRSPLCGRSEHQPRCGGDIQTNIVYMYLRVECMYIFIYILK